MGLRTTVLTQSVKCILFPGCLPPATPPAAPPPRTPTNYCLNAGSKGQRFCLLYDLLSTLNSVWHTVGAYWTFVELANEEEVVHQLDMV